MFFLLLTTLFGCQPQTWELCYNNALLEEDICERDYDNDQEQQVLNACTYNSGLYQSEGCASEAKAYQQCVQEIMLNDPDCEDLFEDLSDNCSEQSGRLDGCLAR